MLIIYSKLQEQKHEFFSKFRERERALKLFKSKFALPIFLFHFFYKDQREDNCVFKYDLLKT